MHTHHAAPRLVLCEDDPVLRRWVSRLAESAGVEVVAQVDQWPQALEQVVEHEADAIVVDLATVGRVGIRLIRALRRLAPHCDVLVISPLHTVGLSALEAGAEVVTGPTDLRPLAAAFAALAQQRSPAA